MNTDKRKLYLLSLFIPVLLIPILFVPSNFCRLVAAAALIILVCASLWLIKKKNIVSFHYRSVTALLAVIAVVYVTLTYLVGTRLGFIKNPTPLSPDSLRKIILPSVAIIVFSELIRRVLVSQGRKIPAICAYIACMIADVLLAGGLSHVSKLAGFLDVVGLALFPAITSNLFYNYLSKRYGAVSVIVYRLILTLPFSVLPILPALSDAVNSFLLMIIPLLAWAFIDLLYEKKEKYARGKRYKWSLVGMVASILCMASVVLLISGYLPCKLIIVATPSMTGEINEGDAIIYKSYSDQTIQVNSIVVFTKNDCSQNNRRPANRRNSLLRHKGRCK